MKISTQGGKHNLGTARAPLLHAPFTTRRMMLHVILSLIPAIAVEIYCLGFGVAWQLLTTSTVALLATALCALLRRRKVGHYLSDLSWLVTALILGLALPPLLCWQITAAATLFAILIAKEAFGGLGMNIFNPAMAGFVFVLVSSSHAFYGGWAVPCPNAVAVATPSATAKVILGKADPLELRALVQAAARDGADGITGATDASSGATYLGVVKVARKAGSAQDLVPFDPLDRTGLGYLIIAAAYALGGLWLTLARIIPITQVLAFFAVLIGISEGAHYLWPLDTVGTGANLFLGGAVLAGIYIITDPVTSATRTGGRIAFAVLCAALILLLRQFCSYSDSVAFAVLLTNALAPLMERAGRRRPFGSGLNLGA
ncbi:MAG: RnfABCDGE type electron transport complex subunit D [Succinivibrionaceae bacterium]|nr:RnfABCDGE type electron transport complex subunit D [Succinivibrionaceae bacterium]